MRLLDHCIHGGGRDGGMVGLYTVGVVGWASCVVMGWVCGVMWWGGMVSFVQWWGDSFVGDIEGSVGWCSRALVKLWGWCSGTVIEWCGWWSGSL